MILSRRANPTLAPSVSAILVTAARWAEISGRGRCPRTWITLKNSASLFANEYAARKRCVRAPQGFKATILKEKQKKSCLKSRFKEKCVDSEEWNWSLSPRVTFGKSAVAVLRLRRWFYAPVWIEVFLASNSFCDISPAMSWTLRLFSSVSISVHLAIWAARIALLSRLQALKIESGIWTTSLLPESWKISAFRLLLQPVALRNQGRSPERGPETTRAKLETFCWNVPDCQCFWNLSIMHQYEAIRILPAV